MERDPRISMLVVNDIDEAPFWVRFDGTARIDRDGDAESFAVNVLEPRYWDMTQPDAIAFAESIRSAPAGSFVIIELAPERIAFSPG